MECWMLCMLMPVHAAVTLSAAAADSCAPPVCVWSLSACRKDRDAARALLPPGKFIEVFMKVSRGMLLALL
jgi:adenylylsulfate kinase-like enzyme